MTLIFFFNDTATTEIYTLSLHDALPISHCGAGRSRARKRVSLKYRSFLQRIGGRPSRSEEHTSELQSQSNLVCRLLLEKKTIHEAKDAAIQGMDAGRRSWRGAHAGIVRR